MENIDWGKALVDVVDALRDIAGSLDRIEDELHELGERGILVYKGESDGN